MSTARFDVARFETERAARGGAFGVDVAWPDLTDSTNDDALSAAKAGAAHGAVFGAEAQTRGRGRRGNAWQSAPGAGLWFSVLLRPRLSPELSPGLSLCAGLAVREAVAARAAGPVQVKWPNDVLAGERKIAGVLIESQVNGSRLTGAVVGIGLNVEQLDFPGELSELATSLALLGAEDRGRERLLAHVLLELERRLARLESGGFGAIAGELRRHDALLGRLLRVDERAGTGAGVDDAGRLLLRDDAGNVESLVAGHVTILG